MSLSIILEYNFYILKQFLHDTHDNVKSQFFIAFPWCTLFNTTLIYELTNPLQRLNVEDNEEQHSKEENKMPKILVGAKGGLVD